MNIEELKSDVIAYNATVQQANDIQKRYLSKCEKIVSLYCQVYSEFSEQRREYEKYCDDSVAPYPEPEDGVPYYHEFLNIVEVDNGFVVVEVKNVDSHDFEYHCDVKLVIGESHFEDDGHFLESELENWQKELIAQGSEEAAKERLKLVKQRKQLEKLQNELAQFSRSYQNFMELWY